MSIVRAWFSLHRPASRRFYVLSGITLMALKYGADALLAWLVSGVVFSPLDYLNPVYTLRTRALGPVPDWLFVVMAVWALPFLWIGLSMSVRRAMQTGLSPWFGLLFGAPLINYPVILTLCVRSDRPAPSGPAAGTLAVDHKLSGALLGLAAGVGLTLAMTLISAYCLQEYGAVLFVTTPLVIGAAASYFYNRVQLHSFRSSLAVAGAAVALGGASLLLFAVEGVLCVVIALPLALVAAGFGAGIARLIAASGRGGRAGPLLLALALPALAGVEHWPERSVLHEVSSRVEVDAPPEIVWRHVIGFSDLPAPDDWLFHTGIAYPLRATIQGQGVGAVRHCVFSTGPFVEPITHWQEPTRLAFDVASQPAPMQEWSPYKHVHPPHLDSYLRSRRGEFRLLSLPGGRTRLEGRTWYELDLWPQPYFTVWSHWTIQRIHARVLNHVKQLAEREAQAHQAVAPPAHTTTTTVRTARRRPEDGCVP
jgi:uncharacterized membrane protein YhaH (DUF805 family)